MTYHDRQGFVEMVILVCPVCATPQDAEVSDQPEDFECLSCGQVWTMVVDGHRVAEHAL